MSRVLTLYGHVYCSLCDVMKAALIPFQEELGFLLQWEDIEGNAALEESFGEDVPVLMEGDQWICHHRLDEEALNQHFT